MFLLLYHSGCGVRRCFLGDGIVLSNCRGEISTDLFDIKDKKDIIGSTNGGRMMKAIMYFPKGRTEVLELEDRIAKVHAEAVVAKVNSLELTIEEKNALIDGVLDRVRG